MSVPSNFIQWKGTDVCIDVHCSCGEHHHFDVDFFYFWKCHVCGQCWKMGSEVKMTPIGHEPESCLHVSEPDWQPLIPEIFKVEGVTSVGEDDDAIKIHVKTRAAADSVIALLDDRIIKRVRIFVAEGET